MTTPNPPKATAAAADAIAAATSADAVAASTPTAARTASGSASGLADSAAPSVALFTARALVDELSRGGVRHFCVAPGSRSTALALAVAERGDLASYVRTDERSMGFFALGLARATASPVAVVCTSGTAAANLLPAAAEATLGGGALLLITADRPPELRDCAAPQTIDQAGIFGSHARWAADVPILETSEMAARTLRSIASRAVAKASQGIGGAVHLNVPLREPFVDESFPSRQRFNIAARSDQRPFTTVSVEPTFAIDDARALANRLRGCERGVVVCCGGELPTDAVPAVAELARVLGWPILADPLSGLRFGPHDRSLVVDAIEPLLRSDPLRQSLRPDAILRFGLTPPARAVQRWLEEAWPAEHVVVSQSAWPDPTRSATDIVRASPAEFSRTMLEVLPTANPSEVWRDHWLALSSAARSQLAATTAGTLFDGVVLKAVVDALPDGATLVVGNSMPVRDADTFLPSSSKHLRVLANRGASGIDGVLSTALGVATASKTPTALVIGDLSFLHDSSALIYAANENIPLLIVVVNNDGGGIFSYLPLHDSLVASADPTAIAAFERFFGTPHGAELSRVASVTGGFFRSVDRPDELNESVAAALAASTSGPAVLEVRTDREAGRIAHQTLVRNAQASAASPSDKIVRTDPSRRPH